MGNERIEANATKRFTAVSLGVFDNPAQRFDQNDIGPVLPRGLGFIRTEDGQATRYARADVARGYLFAIEAFDE